MRIVPPKHATIYAIAVGIGVIKPEAQNRENMTQEEILAANTAAVEALFGAFPSGDLGIG